MFTGIVLGQGIVRGVERRGGALRARIDLGPHAVDLAVGASVAIDGVCLTATALDGSVAAFDIIAETLARTTLGDLAPGASVNVECPVRVGDPLGGHIVQGHVDGVGSVAAVEPGTGETRLAIRCDAALTDEMVTKGSVALDGVSLTLAEVDHGRFVVALIPHTLAVTTLGRRRTGDRVNIETDIVGKHVVKLVRAALGGAPGAERRPGAPPGAIFG